MILSIVVVVLSISLNVIFAKLCCCSRVAVVSPLHFFFSLSFSSVGVNVFR